MASPSADVPRRDVEISDSPDSHGRFSLSEDWIATFAGLVLLALALLGFLPDIGAWFK